LNANAVEDGAPSAIAAAQNTSFLRPRGEFLNKEMAMRKVLMSFMVAALLMVPATMLAYSNVVVYGGQGVSADDFGGYDLQTELCGVSNGAEVDGPYILWILTANKAKNADITGPWGTAPMQKFGNNGTFKYVSGWFDPEILINSVTATYDGAAKNAQLVISHGCRPYAQGAWCSPGFWKNATDAAWARTGINKTDLFNLTVYDYFYGETFEANPSIYTVLATSGGTYKGSPVAGISGYELNAYNAVGAYLTSLIPGFSFDWDVMVEGADDACPLDHHGNFK
jgi:hypothetical protein